MTRFTLNEVEDVLLGGIDPRDYPDMADAFIEEATCKETGRKLTDAELEQLTNDYADEINEWACEQVCGG